MADLKLTFACGPYDRMEPVRSGEIAPGGIEANRATLETCIRYMVEQHFIAAPMKLDDLFLPVG